MAKHFLEDLKQLSDEKALNTYWRMIYERHNIWHKRFVQELPAPWTEDPIMSVYKFTNVYRELDKGTIYALDNIIGQGEPIDVIWNLLVYRIFNRMSTMSHLGFLEYQDFLKPDPCWFDGTGADLMNKLLRDVIASGESIYTDAHMVCAYAGTPGDDKLARIIYLLKQLHPKVPQLVKLCKDPNTTSLKQVWEWIQNQDGYGPFLAYEVAVDITYGAPELTHLHEDEWANPGPGCQRGIDAMFPDRPRSVSYLDVIESLREYQQYEFARLSLPFSDIAYQGKWLTYRNIEHCCCEFFKYWKAMNGTGRPRNQFKVTSTDPELVERLKG